MDECSEPDEPKKAASEEDKKKDFPFDKYIKLTDWETGKPIYLRRKETIITKVAELHATEKHTA